MIVRCDNCGRETRFDQPRAYHAGFGNQGFLYDDAGTCTLTWSSYDPQYAALVGGKHPWTLSPQEQAAVEEALVPAPSGGRWRFTNPPRCAACSQPIGGPMMEDLYYLLFAGSLQLDDAQKLGFRSVMRDIG